MVTTRVNSLLIGTPHPIRTKGRMTGRRQHESDLARRNLFRLIDCDCFCCGRTVGSTPWHLVARGGTTCRLAISSTSSQSLTAVFVVSGRSGQLFNSVAGYKFTRMVGMEGSSSSEPTCIVSRSISMSQYLLGENRKSINWLLILPCFGSSY